MKNHKSPSKTTVPYKYLCVLVFLIGQWPASGQTSLYGPEYPPPKDYSIDPSLNTSDGQLGRSGGRTYTFNNITLANTTKVYWAIYPDEVMLSMDGEEYSPNEIMDLDESNTNLGTGQVFWTGTTYMPFSTGGGANLFTRFILTVTNDDGSPFPLIDPVSAGLDPKSGGVVTITDHTMIFKTRLELFVSENGSSWTPHLVYYEAHNHVPTIQAYYSIDFGFWWENDPPRLVKNLGANVDEGDTVLINSGALSAEDLESSSSEILFLLNPGDGPDLPAHGKLYLNDDMLSPGASLSLENLETDKVYYIHDGSETIIDSISFSLVDSQGGKCIIDGDSVFYFLFTITPQDDIPILEINLPVTVDEESTIVINEDHLFASDAESGPDKITFRIDAVTYNGYPQWGTLRKNGTPLTNGDSFTQSDIAAGLITYKQNGAEYTEDHFGFTVEDEFGHLAKGPDGNPVFVFEIMINPVNDAPKLTKLMTLVMDEGGEGIINNAVLAASDDDNETDEILFTLDPNSEIGNPWCGEVKLDGTALDDGEYFTMEDINSGKVTFDHDGSETYNEIFGFRLSDNAGAIYYDGEWDVFHFNIEINPVNDPPVVHRSIPDFNIRASETWTYRFPDTTFYDPDPDDLLSYRAEKLDQGDLPAWMGFTPATRTFTATPTANDHGELFIIVIAQDLAMETARDTFMVYVRAVGMETEDYPENIQIYPNPCGDLVTLHIPESFIGINQIGMYNIVGEQVYLFKDISPGENSLELAGLAPGLYLIQIEINGYKMYMKLYKR